MGTRHLTAVVLDGQYRIAQYGQWDGYPSGQGATILKFLEGWDRPLFEEKLRAAQASKPEDEEALWASLGVEPGARFVPMDKAKEFAKLAPQLDRDMGARVLQYVQDQPHGVRLRNEIDFAQDSLFCEWAYVLDLDQNRLEVFKGFNQTPLAEGERFYRPEQKREKYYAVRLVEAYPLDALPSLGELVRDCDPPGAEE